jgi:hypothetical protein
VHTAVHRAHTIDIRLTKIVTASSIVERILLAIQRHCGTARRLLAHTVEVRMLRVKACILLVIGHVLVGSEAFGGTLAATDCSAGAVQAAIDAAHNGDTIIIPAGTCTWSSKVSIPGTKAMTLRGEGIDRTVIVDAIASGPALDIVVGSGIVRVTALSLSLRGVDKTGLNASVNITGAGMDRFRIDHVHFREIRARGILVRLFGSILSGVIDHNTFDCPYDATCQAITVVGNSPQESGSLDRPYTPGSGDAIFAEDNTFNYAFQNDAGLEGYGGARYVFRFNELHGVTQGHHGADSGNYRGTQTFEIYNNTFDSPQSPGMRAHQFRSGTGVVFNNSYSADYGSMHLDNYRSRGSYGVWGECNGSSLFDGNQSSKQGYPCLDQIGWLFFTLDGQRSLTPLYVFGNVKGEMPFGAAPVATGNVPLHIVENRDFYNETASFNGTSGIGVGPRSNRPTTCSTGVGYWATDEGEWNRTNAAADGKLYRCTGSNAWTDYFTPYAYPHPLQSVGLPPTNLRLIN